MREGIPRISVLVITYNQEDVIERAMNSLVSQKEYLYEICVSDDCSKDRTWEILQGYSAKYPGLFKLNRNNPNVGIFENVEKTWTMPSGDLIYQIAGDDAIGEGWPQKVVEYIQNNSIDYKNELFCIYGDYKAEYLNGDSYIHDNSCVLLGINPIKLSLRGLLGNRSAVYSYGVLKRFKNVSQGRSYIAEASQDRQLQIFTKTNYYIPYVGNVYYSGIGVSTAINGERHEQHLARWDYLITNLKDWGVQLDDRDYAYIMYKKAQERKDKIAAFCLFFKSLDFKIGIRGLQIRRIAFAILRRLPHHKTISNFRV